MNGKSAVRLIMSNLFSIPAVLWIVWQKMIRDHLQQKGRRVLTAGSRKGKMRFGDGDGRETRLNLLKFMSLLISWYNKE